MIRLSQMTAVLAFSAVLGATAWTTSAWSQEPPTGERASEAAEPSVAAEASQVPSAAAAAPAAPVPGMAAVEAGGEALLAIHGYGNWGAGVTDRQAYSIARSHGEYRFLQMALGFTASPVDRLTVVLQPFIGSGAEGFEAMIDIAFARWTIRDWVRLQAGRSRQPLGLYSEILEIGTVRPFMLLPQSVYGPAGVSGEGYDGVSLNGSIELGHWGIEYDLFAGAIAVPFDGTVLEAGELLEHAAAEPVAEVGEEDERALDGVAGGRLTLMLPVRGLQVGLAGYSGRDRAEDGRHSVGGLQAQYVGHGLTVRAEAYLVRAALEQISAYAEAAYRLDSIEVAVRYDFAELDSEELGEVVPASVRRHREVAVGLAFWQSGNFGLKLSGHYILGNRFAHGTAEALAAHVRDGDTRERTLLGVVGASYSF